MEKIFVNIELKVLQIYFRTTYAEITSTYQQHTTIQRLFLQYFKNKSLKYPIINLLNSTIPNDILATEIEKYIQLNKFGDIEQLTLQLFRIAYYQKQYCLYWIFKKIQQEQNGTEQKVELRKLELRDCSHNKLHLPNLSEEIKQIKLILKQIDELQ